MKVYEATLFLRRKDLALNTGSDPGQDSGGPLLIDLSDIQALKNCVDLPNTLFQAEDIFIRQRVEPVQSVLDTWIKGAKAQVNGQDIPFSQIISWCQETASKEDRDKLRKEARSLCRFLAPFSHATWKALLECVENELGYPDYLSFCRKKRRGSFLEYPGPALDFLELSRETYFPAMERWLKSMNYSIGTADANRFDAIYLLGMRYLDHLFPMEMKGTRGTRIFLEFFKGMFPEGGKINFHVSGEKGRQAYCIPVEIPGEIHVLTGPIYGWQDLEALFHEFGHAVFFSCNNPDLDPEEKDYFQSAALSECFAFLFQLLSMSRKFLRDVLKIEDETAEVLEAVQTLKFLTLSRRYASKTFIEHENFRMERVSHGQALYAESMKKYTGFFYDPETYLFDLMPDFYSVDYFEAFLGAFILKDFLERSWGHRWFSNPHAVSLLRSWWQDGNRHALSDFIEERMGRRLDGNLMVDSAKNIPEDLFHNVKKMAQIV